MDMDNRAEKLAEAIGFLSLAVVNFMHNEDATVDGLEKAKLNLVNAIKGLW